jgi:hypothetical protein
VKRVSTIFNLTGILPGGYSWRISCADVYNKSNSTMLQRFTIIELNSFDGDTTNISGLIATNVTNLTIEKSSFGKIVFNSSLNLSNGGNYTFAINISSNFVEINSSYVPQLNSSAQITLNGLSFVNPRILKNGVICSSNECHKESYSNGTLIFSVTGFSNYSAEETPIVSEILSENSKGGGGGSVPIVKIQLEDLKSGYYINVGKLQWLELPIGIIDNKTLMKVDYFNKDFVNIKIDDINYLLNKSGSLTLDLDDNGFYDVGIVYVLNSEGYVRLKFILYSNESNNNLSNNRVENGTHSIESEGLIFYGNFTKYYNYFLFFVIFIIILWLLIRKYRRR